MKWHALMAGSLALSVALSARAEAGPSNVESAARAEQLFKQGTRAFEAAEYADAFAAFRTAWDLAPSYRTAGGLGQVELQLGQYRDAAEHFSYCLRAFPEDGDAEARGHVERGLDEARKHVGAVRVRVSAEGATVLVDGVAVGRAPLPGLVFVAPGSHVVSTSLPGHASPSVSVDVAVRTTLDVELEPEPGLAAAEGPPALAAPAPPSRAGREAGAGSGARTGPSPSTWVLIVGGALTAASLTTALVFEVRGASADDDADGARRRVASGSCSNPPPADRAACTELSGAVDRRDSDRRLATAAAVSAGVFAVATGTTAILVWDRPPEKRAAVAVSAVLAPHAGALSVTGRF